MKRYFIFLSFLLLLLMGGMGVAAALQQDTSSSQSNPKPAASSTTEKSNTQAMTGEQVFEANCARCHKPPMTIPPRATGTIIAHMRVRARLSRQDEQLLLKFMAP